MFPSLPPNGCDPRSSCDEPDGRLCDLEFQPNRFFGCRIENVLADFFRTDEPRLNAMPTAFRELTQGIVRPQLDDRVTLKASFSPLNGWGNATLSLRYRLPSADKKLLDQLLASLDRAPGVRGYYRFCCGLEAALHGSIRVRSTVVGQRAGETYLLTTLLLGIFAQLHDERNGAEGDRRRFPRNGAQT